MLLLLLLETKSCVDVLRCVTRLALLCCPCWALVVGPSLCPRGGLCCNRPTKPFGPNVPFTPFVAGVGWAPHGVLLLDLGAILPQMRSAVHKHWADRHRHTLLRRLRDSVVVVM
jgi:hypothetical protein